MKISRRTPERTSGIPVVPVFHPFQTCLQPPATYFHVPPCVSSVPLLISDSNLRQSFRDPQVVQGEKKKEKETMVGGRGEGTGAG